MWSGASRMPYEGMGALVRTLPHPGSRGGSGVRWPWGQWGQRGPPSPVICSASPARWMTTVAGEVRGGGGRAQGQWLGDRRDRGGRVGRRGSPDRHRGRPARPAAHPGGDGARCGPDRCRGHPTGGGPDAGRGSRLPPSAGGGGDAPVVLRDLPQPPKVAPRKPASKASIAPRTAQEHLRAAYAGSVRLAPASCHLSESLLAAIGQVESALSADAAWVPITTPPQRSAVRP